MPESESSALLVPRYRSWSKNPRSGADDTISGTHKFKA